MDQMTSKERIINALHNKEVDRLPFCPFLAYVWEHFPKEITDKGQLAFIKEVGADPLWRGSDCPVKQTVKGAEVKTYVQDGKIYTKTITPVGELLSYHVRTDISNSTFWVGHPLQTEEDYKIQMWIEEHTEFEYNLEPAAYVNAMEGLALGMLLPRGGSAFQQLVEDFVGTEKLALDLYDFPDTVESLLEIAIENDLKAVRMAAESAYDYFLTFENSSTTNYSPALYKKYISKEIKSITSILKQYNKFYVQHACGHVKALLPIMKADGVFAIDSLSPMPTGNISLRDARAILGGEVGIIGGIEPIHFLNLSLEEL
ncbi:MAG TPA: uroporphyrinogen decarboxylase family protein, partial [Clostridia bacterium]|nr:uroporphyrinogen decarboxylase family protein [Clostridia bacterium]